jgi:fructosamine-3-kinase
VTRTFLNAGDLGDLVTDHFGSRRRLAALDRLTGGTKKGVYRLRLDDGATAVLYVWAAGENYWPPSEEVPDDPFTDANGAELFEVNHAALTGAGVRVPRLLLLDRDRRHLDADLALVEDAGAVFLEGLIERDPAAAAEPLATLGASLRRMHTTYGPGYGKLTALVHGTAPQDRATEDVITDRALRHLETVARREPRVAEARSRIAEHIQLLRSTVRPRQAYALIHGELGPDHVLVTPDGSPVMIDFEGLTYFDVEWEHAWLQLRFREAYGRLDPVDLDPQRLELYRYAQVLALIEGPLRIADTDFPDRRWMLDLAEWNVTKALAVL